MSYQMTKRVFRHSRSRNAARLVLLYLADWWREDRPGVYLTQSQIAEGAAIDVRSVRRALKQLQDMGELVIVGKHRSGAPVYDIRLAGGPVSDEQAEDTGQIVRPAKMPAPAGQSVRRTGQVARARDIEISREMERQRAGARPSPARMSIPPAYAVGDVRSHLQAATWTLLRSGAYLERNGPMRGQVRLGELLDDVKAIAGKLRAKWTHAREISGIVEGVVVRYERERATGLPSPNRTRVGGRWRTVHGRERLNA